MADRGTIFTEKSGQRISDVVHKVERKPSIEPWWRRKKDSKLKVRGTKRLFKGMFLRAYWKEANGGHEANELVDADQAFSFTTMYLYPTWDWPRFHGGGAS